MVKVVDLKERAIERLEGYRDDPRSLPGLVHARYRSAVGYDKDGVRRVKQPNFSLRSHKPHQMHAQHRNSCVLVLQWLIKKMDVKTRQCVFVNPTFGIRRTIYVPEISRHTGLCERTVTRVLGSIGRAGYMIRKIVGKDHLVHNFYLTERLFRDLKLDVTLNVLTRKMLGLEKKEQKQPGAAKPSPKSSPSHPSSSKKNVDDLARPYAPKVITEESRTLGNSFLDQLRPRRRKPPG